MSEVLEFKKQYNELIKKQYKYTEKIALICKDLKDTDELIEILQFEKEFYLELQDTKRKIEYILEQLKNLKVDVTNIEILKGFEIDE